MSRATDYINGYGLNVNDSLRSIIGEAYTAGARDMVDEICKELKAFNKLSFFGLPTYDVEAFRAKMMQELKMYTEL